MSDDHAAKAIGAYGHCIKATPNIDRLAAEGMRLVRSISSRCGASRWVCATSARAGKAVVQLYLAPLDDGRRAGLAPAAAVAGRLQHVGVGA